MRFVSVLAVLSLMSCVKTNETSNELSFYEYMNMYNSYAEKYEYIPADMNDNQIAFVELFGTIITVDGQDWEVYDNKRLLKYRSEEDDDISVEGQSEQRDYDIVNNISEVMLNDYDGEIQYTNLAKLIRAGYTKEATRLLDERDVDGIRNIRVTEPNSRIRDRFSQ